MLWEIRRQYRPLGLPQSSPVFDAKLRYNSVPNPRRACIPWHISRESPASTRNLTEDIHQKWGVTMPWMGHISLCWSLRLWTNQVGCRFIISPRARLDHLQSGLVQACTQKPWLKCKPKRNKQPPWWSPELPSTKLLSSDFQGYTVAVPPSIVHPCVWQLSRSSDRHLTYPTIVWRFWREYLHDPNVSSFNPLVSYQQKSFQSTSIHINPHQSHQATSIYWMWLRPRGKTKSGCRSEDKSSISWSSSSKSSSNARSCLISVEYP